MASSYTQEPPLHQHPYYRSTEPQDPNDYPTSPLVPTIAGPLAQQLPPNPNLHPTSVQPTPAITLYPSQHNHQYPSPIHSANIVVGSNSTPVSTSPALLGSASHEDPKSRRQSRSASPSRLTKRRSWFGFGGAPQQRAEQSSSALAWFITPDGKRDFDINTLLTGQLVTELWDLNGDTTVYIFPKHFKYGPSFKIHSSTLATSALRDQLVIKAQSPPSAGPVSYRLFFPAPIRSQLDAQAPVVHGLAPDDIEALIAVRNFFAFLSRKPVLSSRRNRHFFGVFLAIAHFIQSSRFHGADSNSYGDFIEQNLSFYTQALGLADVRESREKTIEGLVLGEKLKFWEIYNEAFVHAAGKWAEIKGLNSPHMNMVSELTQRRLERSSLDLDRRAQVLKDHLQSFNFPSLWAGLASEADEQKAVRFNKWRAAFNSMRSWLQSQYKHRYGSWPPKARSKKNHFEEDGLNRLLLREVYNDLCDIYDLLADRTNQTTREIGLYATNRVDEMHGTGQQALRRLLDEFDKSDVPVLPPIPFDVPRLASLPTPYQQIIIDPAAESVLATRKLKNDELEQALQSSYNPLTRPPSLFVQAFKEFERKEANGRSLASIQDQRSGRWIFLYTVIQSLPMTVMDAPGLKYRDGVEYFLCQAPFGQQPWAEEQEVKRSWYNVNNGPLVQVASHQVELGVEGIFQRSHCWLVAQEWLLEAQRRSNESELDARMRGVRLGTR